MINPESNTEHRNCVDEIKGDCPFMKRNEFKVATCTIDNIVQVEYYGCIPQNVLDKDKPKLTDEFTGILISPNSKCYQYGQALMPHYITGQWAIGSGADFALGAMAAGADAIDAVSIAIDLDVNSGLGVTYLNLRETAEEPWE